MSAPSASSDDFHRFRTAPSLDGFARLLRPDVVCASRSLDEAGMARERVTCFDPRPLPAPAARRKTIFTPPPARW